MRGLSQVRGWVAWCVALSTICVSLTSTCLAQSSQVGDCIALFFTKSNSKPCNDTEPVVTQAIESGWAIRIVDGQREPSFAKRWRIENYPTIVLVRNGKELDRLLGVTSLETLTRRMLNASSPESLRVAQYRPMKRNVFEADVVRGQSTSTIVPLATSSLSSSFHSSGNPPQGTFPSAIAQAPATDLATFTATQNTLPSNPAEATVRIRVDEPNHEAIGTGTIIDSYQGEALVLTCGHLFRDATPNSQINIETFIGGVQKTYPATLIDFRADQADIGLITFRPEGPIASAKLMDHRDGLREGEAVFSWECDHGANPSRRDSRITKLNRYLGEPNVEVYGAPVQGRSGGGLFNSRGELIGVCYAADNELNEGLYNAPQVVYQQLNRLGLQRLYASKTAVAASAHPTNTAPSHIDQFTSITSADSPAGVSPANASMGTAPIARQARVTVLVENEQGHSQRMEINNPSPELLQTLQNHSMLQTHAMVR